MLVNVFKGDGAERPRKSSKSSKGVGLFPTVTIHAMLKCPLTTKKGWKMALNEDQAKGLAKELLLAMGNSGSLKTVGPYSGAGASDPANSRRGQYDAVYLSALYRELVSGFQK